jgi:hypothetical protein
MNGLDLEANFIQHEFTRGSVEKLTPMGEVVPRGEHSPLRSPQGANTLFSLEERSSPLGANFNPRGHITTQGLKKNLPQESS